MPSKDNNNKKRSYKYSCGFFLGGGGSLSVKHLHPLSTNYLHMVIPAIAGTGNISMHNSSMYSHNMSFFSMSIPHIILQFVLTIHNFFFYYDLTMHNYLVCPHNKHFFIMTSPYIIILFVLTVNIFYYDLTMHNYLVCPHNKHFFIMTSPFIIILFVLTVNISLLWPHHA